VFLPAVVLGGGEQAAAAGGGREHDSRKIPIQQEYSGLFFLLNVFLPADVLGSSC